MKTGEYERARQWADSTAFCTKLTLTGHVEKTNDRDYEVEERYEQISISPPSIPLNRTGPMLHTTRDIFEQSSVLQSIITHTSTSPALP